MHYVSRALEVYQLEKKRAEDYAISQASRSQQELKDRYDLYIRQEVDKLKHTIPSDELACLEENAREYIRSKAPPNLRSWGKDNSLFEMGTAIHLTWILAERLHLPSFEDWRDKLTASQ